MRAGQDLIPKGLRTEQLSIERGSVTICVASVEPSARCPVCDRPSRRAHSRYVRAITDLPWHGTPVLLRARVRRFFCDEPSCERGIFCERLPKIAPRARKTGRVEEALLAIALELGGRAGARLAAELGLGAGHDALLKRVRTAPLPDAGKVEVLGVDDFAFRKGNAYGTILVDLKRRRVVDLLPERSQESLASWLKDHPGVRVATRDRSNVYARGISEGAPDAAQVADRWHLLHSLALGLEDFLLHKRCVLRAAATLEESDGEPAPEPVAGGSAVTVDVPSKREYESIEEPARKRHERLVEQWEEIRRLHLAGARVNDIARWTGTSLRTVYRYRDLEQPPPRRRYKRRVSVLDPYVSYLVRRWNEGCHSGKKLYAEIRKQGYSHSQATVNRLLSNLRYTESQGKRLSHVPRAKKGSIAGSSPMAKNVAALFMRREERLNEEQREYLERLCASDAALADARRLTQDFARMARELEGGKLDEWLEEADGCEASVIRRFSASLKKDLPAVCSGLTE